MLPCQEQYCTDPQGYFKQQAECFLKIRHAWAQRNWCQRRLKRALVQGESDADTEEHADALPAKFAAMVAALRCAPLCAASTGAETQAAHVPTLQRCDTMHVLGRSAML